MKLLNDCFGLPLRTTCIIIAIASIISEMSLLAFPMYPARFLKEKKLPKTPGVDYSLASAVAVFTRRFFCVSNVYYGFPLKLMMPAGDLCSWGDSNETFIKCFWKSFSCLPRKVFRLIDLLAPLWLLRGAMMEQWPPLIPWLVTRIRDVYLSAMLTGSCFAAIFFVREWNCFLLLTWAVILQAAITCSYLLVASYLNSLCKAKPSVEEAICD